MFFRYVARGGRQNIKAVLDLTGNFGAGHDSYPGGGELDG